MSTTSTAVSGGIASMGIRRMLAGALTAPLFFATAACGGDDTSVADPPISPHSSSSSRTASPQRESPEHFIRRFISTSNAMEKRGGTQAYLRLTRGCKPCLSLATQIASTRANGGFYRSKGWSIKRMHADVPNSKGDVDVAVRSAPTSFKASARASIQHYSGGDFTFRISLRWIGTGWKVTNVAQVAA